MPSFRVLFVTSMWPDPDRPHYGTFIQSQARSLEEAGLAVDVLAIRGYVSTKAYPAARRRVLRLARDDDYDAVHVHTGHAATVGILGLPVPVIVSFVGGDLLGHPKNRGVTIKSRIEVLLFRQLARGADATITKSVEMELALPKSLRPRNHVIPNGVDLQAFQAQSKASARALLGWDPDEAVVLFIGDPADARKNLALARAAVEEVQTRKVGVRLHVAWGVGPEQVPLLMAAANALVFTSRSEGSPNVVKEAMAAALPIVATPVGDIPERLSGVSGCFIEDASPGAFAHALLRALEHGPATEAQEAVKALSLGAIARRVVAVYQSTVRDSGHVPE